MNAHEFASQNPADAGKAIANNYPEFDVVDDETPEQRESYRVIRAIADLLHYGDTLGMDADGLIESAREHHNDERD